MRTLVVFALALFTVLLASTLAAGSIPELGDGRITDLTGTLDDDEIEDAESALADLEEEEGIDLFALFVETSGDSDPAAFTEEVAQAEGLGGDDALLAVFIEDRATQLFVSDSLTDQVTSDEQDEAIDQANELFSEGDFAGGVIAAGESLAEAASGESSGDDGGGGGISFGTIALIVIIGAVVVLGGMWLLGLWQGDRSKKRAAEEKDRQTGELARRANSALIDTDEALREADQELGFAEAQFSESDVEPFRLALEEAREELKTAFIVRQQLDDENPEDADTRRKMLQEILAHCDKALAGINQQKERLRQLRELEKNAPDVLSKLPGRIEVLRGRVAATRAVFERLKAYNPASWAAVSGNGTEAEKRLVFAEAQTAEGKAALDRQDNRAAARAAHAAQVASAEADELLKAIDHMETALTQARSDLPAELRAAEADIEQARRFLASQSETDQSQRLARLNEAEHHLSSAEAESRSQSPDYLLAIKNARHANSTADIVLAEARADSEKRERLTASYASALREAQSAYTIANDYIGGRRRGVGNPARTRLAEARRHLDAAQNLGATEAGLKEAERAETLADQALQDARSEFDEYENRGGGFRIGGIPIPILIGGGGWGGGWGGTRWGGTGGGRSGGWGGGRSMGGGWGGGGGRTRGGRW
jgi:TPM domain